jgi:hypothetical protein
VGVISVVAWSMVSVQFAERVGYDDLVRGRWARRVAAASAVAVVLSACESGRSSPGRVVGGVHFHSFNVEVLQEVHMKAHVQASSDGYTRVDVKAWTVSNRDRSTCYARPVGQGDEHVQGLS